MAKRPRILLAKVGCDIHERGALTMMSVFRDAGMEVIYTGRYQSEEGVARAAVAEDVDLIAVSDLTGGLVIICRKILVELGRLEAEIPLICGGLLTPSDRQEMMVMGVKACFGVGSSIDGCLDTVCRLLQYQPEKAGQ